ncbi:MAG: class I SAM-dependent methyltransferase [Gammaproteobacteria bacterium]|nr:class I SAM-dependent methyltransferase [Gammaproteobacteria bacterium]MDP6615762.1 class I SAM-dependent methyltransferase [Gammaproteobacteria bacterium]MDP6695552.1 class I SAM-dependent methyltransferase [Gammaproteobacteria bacterium]
MKLEWLQTATGQTLLQQERSVAAAVLERVFGDQIIQIGQWGPPGWLLEAARTQFAAIIGADQDVGAYMLPERLAIASDSVDAVFLPHTLELNPDPHAVLREVHRVLRPDGKLIVLGFNPLSWWGIRNRISPQGYPPGVLSQISRRRLSDWLQLLNLGVDTAVACYATAATGNPGKLLRSTEWFASAYLLVATKETIPLTIIRPQARRRPSLVNSLVNPTTRTSP